jgi:hypothetical protein
MAAGVSERLWSLEDLVAKIDEMASVPKPTPEAVQAKASNEGISLKPTNQRPYTRKK